MQRFRLLLLAGTVLPSLVLAQAAAARPNGIVVAQGGPEDRGPGGHGGPGGPGGPRPGPERGPGPEHGGPGPAQRERPEPRPERAPPEPRQQRPEPREERQAPPRPQPQQAPPPREERQAPPRPQPQQAPQPPRERPEPRQQEQPRPDREDRRQPPQEQRQLREDRQAPPAARPAPDRAPPQAAPAPRAQPQGGPDRPDRPGPDRSPQDREPNRPDRAPPGAERNAQPPAPNAAPGVPGAEPNRPLPPNMRPGVPGRPFQPPGQPAPGQPGAPGQPPGQGPGQPPVPGQLPGQGQFRNDQVQGDRNGPNGPARGTFNVPGRPGYIPGGFRENDQAQDYDQVRRDRREFSTDGRTYYREPGRLIVQDRNGYMIRHDENERFRDLDPRGYRYERRGDDYVSYIDRPGGDRIYTITDDDGRMVRRYRRFADGREVVIIDNSYVGPPRPIYDDVVVLPPPDIRIPRDRYVVEYDRADPGLVYEALTAPPIMAVDRRYTLDQIRYSPDLRARMRSVDIDTINFDTGSFTVTPDQGRRLSVIADAINKAVRANPQEVFLIEGYTDAVGSDIDNLSLSDRRAQSVATVLTQQFQVPPENLTTQGYGEQYLKVNTQAPSRENRRVTVRRITPLLQQGNGQAGAPPPR